MLKTSPTDSKSGWVGEKKLEAEGLVEADLEAGGQPEVATLVAGRGQEEGTLVVEKRSEGEDVEVGDFPEVEHSMAEANREGAGLGVGPRPGVAENKSGGGGGCISGGGERGRRGRSRGGGGGGEGPEVAGNVRGVVGGVDEFGEGGRRWEGG
ncbi:hypothetical protein KFL_001570210, partial [Klebsormidium nitens]